MVTCTGITLVQRVDLGKAVGTSGVIIGKYERDEIKPSIDTASRIADALGVTLDYLVKDAGTKTLTRML